MVDLKTLNAQLENNAQFEPVKAEDVKKVTPRAVETYTDGDIITIPDNYDDIRMFKNTSLGSSDSHPIVMLLPVKRSSGEESALQFYIGSLQKRRSEVTKLADNTLQFVQTRSSDGSVVDSWKSSISLEDFLKKNLGKSFSVKLSDPFSTPAWDRETGRPSTIEVRTDHVATFEWEK